MLEEQKQQTLKALEEYGVNKIHTYNKQVHHFFEVYDQLQNLDKPAGIDKLRADRKAIIHDFGADYDANSAMNMGAGAGVGAGVGTIAAFGAYNGMFYFGTASTGTAISTLKGVVARRAILSSLGGGSIASGGMGITGGMTVLGSVIAIPTITGAWLFKKKKEKELSVKLREIETETKYLNRVLVHATLEFRDSISKLKQLVNISGTDLLSFDAAEQQIVKTTMQYALLIKDIMDISIIDQENKLTPGVHHQIEQCEQRIFMYAYS